MAKAQSVRELASVLEVSKTKAAELAKEAWFPKRDDEGWDVAAVKRAVAAQSRRDEGVGVPVEVGDAQVLAEATDPVEVARAAMRLASRRLGEAGESTSAALEDLKQALEELRKTEKGFLDIAKARGELIERDVAKAVAGQIATRAVRAIEGFETRLASQVEAWLGDSVFRALPSEDRVRRVRSWAIDQTYSVRATEAAELEKLVAAEIADRAA